MTLEMKITQGDNGWILIYMGHDLLPKKKIFSRWEDVIKELDKHFGWYAVGGKHLKQNPYSL